VVELTVTEIQAAAASIGQAGEEDLFSFRARTAGRYTIEAEGETDLMMKSTKRSGGAGQHESSRRFNVLILSPLHPSCR
jgi:hypothetical protein